MRFERVLLAIVMILGLAACGQRDGGDQGAAAPAAESAPAGMTGQKAMDAASEAADDMAAEAEKAAAAAGDTMGEMADDAKDEAMMAMDAAEEMGDEAVDAVEGAADDAAGMMGDKMDEMAH